MAGYSALLVALYWPIVAGHKLFGWDCTREFWPDLEFQVRSIRDGHLPLWNPYSLGGYPAWADPQAGLYHPVNWLCWLGAFVVGTGPWLIQAKALLSLLVGTCGMHAWTWSRTRSGVASVVAALTFLLGSPLLAHKDGSLLWPALYWPWVLLAIDRYRELPSPRRGAMIVGALWLSGTAGHPQSFFFGLLVFTAYALYVSWPPQRWKAVPWRSGLALALLAALLLASTWIPAWSAIASSVRDDRGLDYVLQGPLQLGGLRGLVVPNLDNNWLQALYVGPLALVGLLWLVAIGDRQRRKSTLLWVAIAVLSIVFALGSTGQLLPWFAEHVPGFGLFRLAYRFDLIFAFAAAVLAGDAVSALTVEDSTARRRWIWLGCVGLWIIGATAIGGLADIRVVVSGATLVIAGAFTWVATIPARARGAVRWTIAVALPAIVLVDLWHAGSSTLAILESPPDVAADLAKAEVLAGTHDEWRYFDAAQLLGAGRKVPYFVAYLAGRREESGFSNPIESQRHAEIERAASGLFLLANLNVRYMVGPDAPRARAITPVIARFDDVVPMARWYARVDTKPRAQVLNALATTPPSRRLAAYAESDDVDGLTLPQSNAPPVAAKVVEYEPDRVVVDLTAPSDGVLVLAEAYADGWTADVNDHGERVFRTDYDLRGVVVPAGQSRVVFTYAPRGSVVLPLLFVVGLAALLGLLFAPGRGRLGRLDRA